MNQFWAASDLTCDGASERLAFEPTVMPADHTPTAHWCVDMFQVIASTLSVIKLHPRRVDAEIESYLDINPGGYSQPVSKKFLDLPFGLKGHLYHIGMLNNHGYVTVLFQPGEPCNCHARDDTQLMRWRRAILRQIETVSMYHLPHQTRLRAKWAGTPEDPCTTNFATLGRVRVPLSNDCQPFFDNFLASLEDISETFFQTHRPLIMLHLYGQNHSVTEFTASEYLTAQLDMSRVIHYSVALACNIRANDTIQTRLCPALSRNDMLALFGNNDQIFSKVFNDLFCNLQTLDVDPGVEQLLLQGDFHDDDGSIVPSKELSGIPGIQIYNTFSHFNRPYAAAEPFSNLPYTASVLQPFNLRGDYSAFERYVVTGTGTERSTAAVNAALEEHLDLRVEIVLTVDCTAPHEGFLTEAGHMILWQNVMENSWLWIQDKILPRLQYYDTDNGFPAFLQDYVTHMTSMLDAQVIPYIERRANLSVCDKLMIYVTEELLRYCQNGNPKNLSNWIFVASGIRQSIEQCNFPYIATPGFLAHKRDVATTIDPAFLMKHDGRRVQAGFLGYLSKYGSTFGKNAFAQQSMQRAEIALLEIEQSSPDDVENALWMALRCFFQDIGTKLLKYYRLEPRTTLLLDMCDETTVFRAMERVEWKDHVQIMPEPVSFTEYLKIIEKMWKYAALLYSDNASAIDAVARANANREVHAILSRTYSSHRVLFAFYNKYLATELQQMQHGTSVLRVMRRVMENIGISMLPVFQYGKMSMKKWTRIDYQIATVMQLQVQLEEQPKRGHANDHELLKMLFLERASEWMADFLHSDENGVRPALEQVQQVLVHVHCPSAEVKEMLQFGKNGFPNQSWVLICVLMAQIHAIFQFCAKSKKKMVSFTLRAQEKYRCRQSYAAAFVLAIMQYVGFFSKTDISPEGWEMYAKKKAYNYITNHHLQKAELVSGCKAAGLKSKFEQVAAFSRIACGDLKQYYAECWGIEESLVDKISVGQPLKRACNQ